MEYIIMAQTMCNKYSELKNDNSVAYWVSVHKHYTAHVIEGLIYICIMVWVD